MTKTIASYSRIIDISQPVSAQTACFPGDVPFSKNVTVDFSESKVINLTSFTMSPHVGTHADAPVHIKGSLKAAPPTDSSGDSSGDSSDDSARSAGDGKIVNLEERLDSTTAGAMHLDAFIGRVYVMDLAPHTGPITGAVITDQLSDIAQDEGVRRVIFKTRSECKPHLWEADYSYIGEDVAERLGELGFVLTGLDTPSVDHTESKNLATHHVLDKYKLCWLENLDLSQVEEGEYHLIALPLKLVELEASPVRAVLLS